MGNVESAPLLDEGVDELGAPFQASTTKEKSSTIPDPRLTQKQNESVEDLCKVTRTLIQSMRTVNDTLESITQHEAAVHRLARTFTRLHSHPLTNTSAGQPLASSTPATLTSALSSSSMPADSSL